MLAFETKDTVEPLHTAVCTVASVHYLLSAVRHGYNNRKGHATTFNRLLMAGRQIAAINCSLRHTSHPVSAFETKGTVQPIHTAVSRSRWHPLSTVASANYLLNACHRRYNSRNFRSTACNSRLLLPKLQVAAFNCRLRHTSHSVSAFEQRHCTTTPYSRMWVAAAAWCELPWHSHSAL